MQFRVLLLCSAISSLAACGGGGGGGSSSTPPTPSVELSASSFAFGSQRVGTSSVSQTVAISNVGTAALPISNVTVTGTNAASFTLVNGCSATVAVNTDCTVSVTFTPTSTGSASANLVFQTALATNPSIALIGTGTASAVSPSASSIAFPSQLLSAVPTLQSVQITNIGTAPLNISSLSIAGTDAASFSESDTCSASVPVAGSCTVQITFAPGAAGSQSATLMISSDAPTNPNILLSGVAVTPPAPSVPAVAINVNVLGVAPTTAAGAVNAIDPTGLPLQYTLVTAPSQGSATVNSTTGTLTYLINGYPTLPSISTDSFAVTVSNGYASTVTTVNVALNADPLLPNQWHIQNVGQNAFASVLPSPGNDMNVAGAWAAGYSGRGIKVGVVDSGLEAAHEDLAANVDLSHSINFLTGTNDPTPSSSGFDHGTSVAGIIAAVAFNGKGGRGLAFNASLRGYNYLANESSANLAASFGGVAASADNDVFNASFGNTTTSLQSRSQVAIQADIQATTLRGGLGAPLIYAAGNNFAQIEGQNDPLCTMANNLGVSCGDPANDEHNEDSIPIIVAALSDSGTHADYSNTGSSVWISAYGGEYGWNSAYTAALSPYPWVAPFVLLPAIVTSNHDGCAGYTTPYNPLDNLGASALASNCQYTATMNGTSAATPNVTGAVALMLEANPSLTYRDVKHILATTARKVDPTFSGISAPIFNATNVVLEQGWTTNAAGYSFSNRYGFGGVDTSAAVQAAHTYTNYLPPLKASSTYQALATANNGYVLATGYPLTFNVQESIDSVEQVLLVINIFEAHDGGSSGLTCTQVQLTSPGGTTSILMHAGNGFVNASVNGALLESNAFYGESVNGVWTATFYDFCTYTSNPTWLSLSVPQTLTILGH